MSNEKKEYVMTKKEAEKLVELSNEIRNRTTSYFNDSVIKAFLYMKYKIDDNIDFYSKTKIKYISKEGQDEIIRILLSIKDMIETQCDIVFNNERADVFNKKSLTVEDYMTGKHLGWFGGRAFNGKL